MHQNKSKMNQNIFFWCWGFTFLSGCSSAQDISHSLVNPAHLETLYKQIDIQNEKIGVVWIYCEAPDYELIADDDEGFTCVDDVARALVFYCKQYRLQVMDSTLHKIEELSNFLFYMQNENGAFYNFMLPDKTINTIHPNSQAVPNWWTWRAFWALTEVCLLEKVLPSPLYLECREAIEALLPHVKQFCTDPDRMEQLNGIPIPACFTRTGADQASIILLALTNYYQVEKNEAILDLIQQLGNLLVDIQHGGPDQFPYGAFFSWKNYWHGWGNSQAYALLRAGLITENSAFTKAGLHEVKNFYPYCIQQGFMNEFQVIQKQGSLMIANYQQFPQIAYSLRPMIYAALEAFSQTQDSKYANLAGHLAAWFFGKNPAQRQMYDPATGRTFDGIGSQTNVNTNSGAESTIEGLLSMQAIESSVNSKQALFDYLE
jgi:hypothetical protein